MIIDFLGGCQEVGREAFLIKDRKTNILLDFGVELQPQIQIPILPNLRLNGVIITHSHLDHSGMAPLLYKFQSPKLYATPPTIDLMNLLLEDYVKVAGLTRNFCEYTSYDIQKMNKSCFPVSFRKSFRIGNLTSELLNSNHIPGSSSAVIYGSKNFMYSGDIGSAKTYLLGFTENTYPKIDCLMIESTYSEREHPNRNAEEKRFIKKVNEYENGLVLLPSFSVGRAQELLLTLCENGIERNIYLEGMAQKAADIILYHKKYIKDAKKLKDVLKKVGFVRTKKQRDKVIREGGVVVTTSGMLNGGPIQYYITRTRNMKNVCLLMTGFQAPGTPGEKLLRTGYFETEEIKFKFEHEFQKYDFSGHAGRTELFNLIKKISPKKVICVHGSNTPKFAKEITNQLGIEAFAPEMGDSLELK